MLTLQELREYLEKERKDLIELREKRDLTDEGKGQLEMINLIFEKMDQGEKEESDTNIKKESSEFDEKNI